MNQLIHISKFVIQGKPKIQELQLNLDGVHKGNCNKPEETFIHSRGRLEEHTLLFYNRAYDRENIIHSTTY